MDYPLEHHNVHTNGLRLHVVQCGPADGPLVVLLHSTGHKPANSEIDVPLIYADYYFMEALLRRQSLAAGRPLSVSSAGF